MTCPKSAIPTSTGTKINMISADSMNACPRCFLRDFIISLLRIRRSVLAYIRHSDARLAIKIERGDHGVHCVIRRLYHNVARRVRRIRGDTVYIIDANRNLAVLQARLDNGSRPRGVAVSHHVPYGGCVSCHRRRVPTPVSTKRGVPRAGADLRRHQIVDVEGVAELERPEENWDQDRRCQCELDEC